ncbi:prepilin-type N-terminal cleavage/methylation domain-containing protein [Puniceicoccales bacterium CK1056]|uniref:Prepilin-type N-terminal cleavage/methylation domain-containing protein n=1 Tax=Oceanipulchritudo coccoides TaxID=2706888 RepID=A0A6B2M355_9BACT|nr:prepilin-type N-terminal cleavage/methylation domain-containing protein [Oceanipulchritudo coccoides]NDV62507.1 prepilin-type N-terminal cleavage/methylation domain-containing protein [Oceanipulchritudo coccoides]
MATIYGPSVRMHNLKRTILATGKPVRHGFTLIELIIVIALVALVGGLVVVNAEAIFRGLGEEPVDRILRKAVREARFQAAYLKEPVQLRFDEESVAFLLTGESGQTLKDFSTGLESSANELDVEFEQLLPEEGLNRNASPDTVEIETVTFRPDRSSTPFQVIIDQDGRPYTLRFDPFSDIVIDDSRNP